GIGTTDHPEIDHAPAAYACEEIVVLEQHALGGIPREPRRCEDLFLPCRLTGLIGRFPVGRHVNELGRAQVVVELVVVAVEHDDLVGGGTIIMTDGTDHGFHRADPRRHEVLPRPPYDGHSY